MYRQFKYVNTYIFNICKQKYQQKDSVVYDTVNEARCHQNFKGTIQHVSYWFGYLQFIVKKSKSLSSNKSKPF